MELVIINRPQVLPYRKIHQIVKRAMDLAICLLTLPLTTPLMGLCALLIRLDSPGPALFIQERIGKGGQRFKMYKFRTMQHNLDNSFHRAFMKAFVKGQVGDNGNGKENNLPHAFARVFVKPEPNSNGNGKNGNGRTYKPPQVAQITRVGRLLRKTSLDELPQIFNVLRGEMSLVGPRPNVPWEVEEYRPWHYERLEVLPGLTGLAQVRGRSGISFNTIVRHDIEYVEKQSPALDLKVLWWTFSTVFLGIGAE